MDLPDTDIEGFILAGGASSRMGADKAHLRLEDQSFVERIAEALSALTTRVNIVSSKEDAGAWNLPVVQDIYVGRGALGGIHTALANASAPWAFIVSCDLPFVSVELFSLLASCRRTEFDAVAPLQADGRPQPLCTLYRTTPCLEKVEAMLQAHELRPRVLLLESLTRWVEFSELSELTGAERFFINVNTPADYEHARTLSRPLN